MRFFEDNNDADGPPFQTRARLIARHEHNPRQHAGVKAAYVASVKLRGIVDGVRGELWAVQPDPRAANRQFGALTFGSLTEAFYQALEEEPTNSQLLLSLAKGLNATVFSFRTPPAVTKYLVKLHNRFHVGAATSFVELVQLVPEVPSLPKGVIICFRTISACSLVVF